MRVKIAKWGNSLAVRIPRGVIEKARLKEGQEFDIEALGDGRVEISPLQPRYTLEELVDDMRRLGPLQEPELVEWGPDRGSERLPEDDYTRHREAAVRKKHD